MIVALSFNSISSPTSNPQTKYQLPPNGTVKPVRKISLAASPWKRITRIHSRVRSHRRAALDECLHQEHRGHCMTSRCMQVVEIVKAWVAAIIVFCFYTLRTQVSLVFARDRSGNGLARPNRPGRCRLYRSVRLALSDRSHCHLHTYDLHCYDQHRCHRHFQNRHSRLVSMTVSRLPHRSRLCQCGNPLSMSED